MVRDQREVQAPHDPLYPLLGSHRNHNSCFSPVFDGSNHHQKKYLVFLPEASFLTTRLAFEAPPV